MESPKEEIAQAFNVCVEELVDQVFEDQGLAKVIQELFSGVSLCVPFMYWSPYSGGDHGQLLHGVFVATTCRRPGWKAQQ